MDRFVVKERRAEAAFPPGNELVAFPSNPQPNNMVPEAVYFEGRHGSKFPGMQLGGNTNGGFMSIVHANASPYPQAGMNVALRSGEGQILSGIDPTYLAAYASNNAAYIATGEQSMRDRSQAPSGFGGPYQNRSLTGPERNKSVAFTPQITSDALCHEFSTTPRVQSMVNRAVNMANNTPGANSSERMGSRIIPPSAQQTDALCHEFSTTPRVSMVNRAVNMTNNTNSSERMGSRIISPSAQQNDALCHQSFSTTPQAQSMGNIAVNKTNNTPGASCIASRIVPTSAQQNVSIAQKSDPEPVKIFEQNQVMTRADRLKALHKSGPRAFSGPVEKVLKWHKALQDIGVLVIYEIVAKCVSIRPGESCAKHLVIRDDSGPAMQVVYYEVDFLLPELKPPCTVRVVGRMMPGTCRLHAFNVRPATGDDVATLPRHAAVAAHHVAKLCKEYSINIQ